MDKILSVLILLSISIEITYQKECETLHIESYQELDLLTNCTAILGDLILNFPYYLDELHEPIGYTKEMINNRSFPKLYEITGFFGVIKVTHLDSLGKLFPGLRVIRGRHLFGNFGFFIYDSYIREITLQNLQKVQFGSVAIMYASFSTRLCPPVNIDWSEICEHGQLEVLSHLRSGKACEFLLPTSSSCQSCTKSQGLCWSIQYCQRFENFYTNVGNSGNYTINCSHLCLGGCDASNNNTCFACQDISEDGKCVHKCSPDKFLNVDTRRCISKNDCLQVQGFILQHKGRNECIPKHDNGVTKCPLNFKANINESKCEFCGDSCDKHCDVSNKGSARIKSIENLQDLGTGCTIIHGSVLLEFFPHIKNLQAYLNEYLGNVKEIHGALSINSIPSITSLTFLNKLSFVKGDLSLSEFAVKIFNNHNLNSLFDMEARKNPRISLKIESGQVIVFNNKNLCPSEVDKFMEEVNGERVSLLMMSDWKNKNPLRCTGSEIEPSHKVISNDTVEISWTKVDLNVSFYEIKYFKYIHDDELDETIFNDEPSSCSSSLSRLKSITLDLREVDNVGNVMSNKTSNNFSLNSNPPNAKQMKYNLTGLDHYTRYAYLVQTKDIKLQTGAISSIKNFTTNLTSAMRVQSIQTVQKTPTSIEISWKTTNIGISNDEDFYIEVYKVPYNLSQFDERDYCENPLSEKEKKQILSLHEDNEQVDEKCLSENCCQTCCKDRKLKKEQNRSFEDKLAKYVDSKLEKRSELKDISSISLANKPNYNKTKPSNSTHYKFENLEPYTIYMFRIRVCITVNSGDENSVIYSEYAMYRDMTNPNISAIHPKYDVYDKVIVSGEKVITDKQGIFILDFEEPKYYNGIVLNYVIEVYKFLENHNEKHTTICITRQDFNNDNATEIYVPNGIGKYAYQVTVVTLGNPGRVSNLHHFEVVAESNFIKIIEIILIVFLLIGLIASYYYRQKLRTCMNKQDDQVELMIEPEFEECNLSNEGTGNVRFINTR